MNGRKSKHLRKQAMLMGALWMLEQLNPEDRKDKTFGELWDLVVDKQYVSIPSGTGKVTKVSDFTKRWFVLQEKKDRYEN